MGYDGLVYSIISTVIIIGITFYYWLVPSINNKLLFFPQKVSIDNFYELYNKHKAIFKKVKFMTDDKIMLTGALVNTNKKPEWSGT